MWKKNLVIQITIRSLHCIFIVVFSSQASMAQDLDKSNAVGKRVIWYDKHFFDHILQVLSSCNLVYLLSSHVLYHVCFLPRKARCCCFRCSKRSVLLKSSEDLASTLHQIKNACKASLRCFLDSHTSFPCARVHYIGVTQVFRHCLCYFQLYTA